LTSPNHTDHTECLGLEGTFVGHLVQPSCRAASPTAGCTGPCPGGTRYNSRCCPSFRFTKKFYHC